MGLNLLLQQIKSTLYVAVEPLLLGLLVLIVDMAFIGIKDLIVYLVKRGKRKKQEKLAAEEGISGEGNDV